MILPIALIAVAVFVSYQAWRLSRSGSSDEKANSGNASFLGVLIAAALIVSVFLETSPYVAGIMMAIGLVYALVIRWCISLIEQRDALRRRAQELSKNIEQLDDTATSKIASGESRFRDLAAVVPVGIFETNADRQLVYVNKLLGQMTGLGARKTRQAGFRQAIHPDDQAGTLVAWDEAIEQHLVFEKVFRFIAEGREDIWVVCLCHPRFVEGHYAGHVGMCMDVTERKRQDAAQKKLEEETRRADRYESLGVFASGIAHDFNNLLVPLLGGAKRLAKNLESESPEQRQAAEILKAAQKGADLAAQMLAYTGTKMSETDEVCISEFMENTKNSIQAANVDRVILTFEGSPEPPNAFSANPAQLRQAVMNLVTNAFEAVDPSIGKVAVRWGQRDYSAEDLNGVLIGQNLKPGALTFFEVEDNGSGIEPKDLNRIFDPFFTSKFTGRGLGLAVVSGIMKSIGAGIRIESAPGHGTKVTVIFPEVNPGPDPLAPAPDLPSLIKKDGGCILLIDDEEGVREFIGCLLAERGIEVMTAADGIEGIKIFRRELSRISGVLLDLTMPMMDGDEVLEHLVAMDPGVRVLITSGFAKADVLARIESRKIVGFLPKPFSDESLMKGVNKLLHV